MHAEYERGVVARDDEDVDGVLVAGIVRDTQDEADRAQHPRGVPVKSDARVGGRDGGDECGAVELEEALPDDVRRAAVSMMAPRRRGEPE